MPSKGTPHRKFRCDDAIIRQLVREWVNNKQGEK